MMSIGDVYVISGVGGLTNFSHYPKTLTTSPVNVHRGSDFCGEPFAGEVTSAVNHSQGK